MLSKQQENEILQLLHQEVVPAVGCTEPIAVAYAVARARDLLFSSYKEAPEDVMISLSLSANIIKNAMGVGIPGTRRVGLPIAVALGFLVGRAEKRLEVLEAVSDEAVQRAEKFIKEGRIHIALEEKSPEKLYIHCLLTSSGRTAETLIEGHHTNITLERLCGSTVFQKPHCATERQAGGITLTMALVYEAAVSIPLNSLRFILEAKRLNERAAQSGLKENYGHGLGKTLCSPLGKGIMGDGIFSRILSITSCACDARMAGAMVPVMSNSGSGNQGICATMPVAVFAQENHNTEEELIRALVLSNLTAIYIKQSLGALSALCGCVVASTGSACGITYLMGGTFEQICHSVKNMIANLTGMICDGAKPSCALKLTTGVGTAVLSAMLAIEHKHVTAQEGIIEDSVDKSISNLTRIGSSGMQETDRYVLNIMTHKGK